MSEEASAVSGHLLSVPDTESATIAQLQEDLRTLKGPDGVRSHLEELGYGKREAVWRRSGRVRPAAHRAVVPEPNIKLRSDAGGAL